jgi:BirA family biotin operon repressor/biotin-[acetyl-CoA-carboxylase] ligase
VRLPSAIQTAGYRLIALDSTASTNDEASAAFRSGDPGRLWFVAREQRAGRGRHGRPWTSPPGNLYASLLLVDPCAPAEAAQLGFVAGLALHDAVAETTRLGAPQLALKWPNDLLLDGAKVAGLLLEGHHQPGGAFAVVIGFGVNIAAAPTGTAYPAAALHSVEDDLIPETLFHALSRSFARHFEAWQGGCAQRDPMGFAAVRQQWLARAGGLGGPVAIRLPAGERSGVFAGIDGTGRLQLETAGGLELVDAGDLYFPHAPAAGARSFPISR